MKKVIAFLLVFIVLYYLVGFGLFYFGYIEKLPVFFNTAIRHKSENDHSKAAVDGPYVFYKNNQAIVCRIDQKDTSLLPIRQALEPTMSLHCTGSENVHPFHFKLKTKLVIPPDNYTAPEKMLVLSDIEGNLGAFTSVLRKAEVIDSAYRWSYGQGHLVLLGDFVDRGLQVTEVLWLIYKLEEEAEKEGGRIHFILGNHEVMNMRGNTKYVRKKYKENFKLLGESYASLFSANSEIGRWLRTKNIIEKIGAGIFVHGGISEALIQSGLTISGINQSFRTNVDRAEEMMDAQAELIFDTGRGPLWYRGLASGEASDEEVTAALTNLEAEHMVIGHTLVDSISARYKNKVILIDLPHEENYRKMNTEFLHINQGKMYSMDLHGKNKPLF